MTRMIRAGKHQQRELGAGAGGGERGFSPPNPKSQQVIYDQLSDVQKAMLFEEMSQDESMSFRAPSHRKRFPVVRTALAVASLSAAAVAVHAPDYADTVVTGSMPTKIGQPFCTNETAHIYRDAHVVSYPIDFRVCFTQTPEKKIVSVFNGPDAQASEVTATFFDLETGENIPIATIETRLGGKYDSDVGQIEDALQQARQAEYLSDGDITLVYPGNGGADTIFQQMPTDYTVSARGVSELPKP